LRIESLKKELTVIVVMVAVAIMMMRVMRERKVVSFPALSFSPPHTQTPYQSNVGRVQTLKRESGRVDVAFKRQAVHLLGRVLKVHVDALQVSEGLVLVCFLRVRVGE
jgi:hypothetical protein